MNTKIHYNEAYFEYQKEGGEFGSIANQILFSKYINPQDEVLDFGCGGGYLLKNLKCKKRVGVEINPVAVAVAKENGVEVYATSDLLPDDYVDVVITCHALEHTHYPLKELEGLYRKLRKGGKAVIVVPCESIRWKYKKDDVDQHLYTWSPMSIGNLCKLAGFNVIESRPFIHFGFGGIRNVLLKVFGWKGYHFLCRIHGILGPIYQVRVIATKPAEE